MFRIDCMNSLAFGLNFGNEMLFIRFLDERIADLAESEVVASALAAVDVRVDANDKDPTPELLIPVLVLVATVLS